MLTYRQGIERAFLITLVVGATLFLVWMVRDFLYPVFWAIVFALLLDRSYQWTRARVRSGSLASLLVILVSSILLFIPFWWIGSLVTSEAQQLYTHIASSTFLEQAPQHPLIHSTLSHLGLSIDQVSAELGMALRSVGTWMVTQAFTISSHAMSIAFQFILMAYLLFFFLRDGRSIVGTIEKHLPLSVERTRAVLTRFAATTRGTIKGAFIVALAQGVFGGTLFWIAGVPSPALFGVLITFLAFLPIVGPIFIWLPTAIVLALSGAYVPALVVALGSLSINILMDDIIRPMLVGRSTHMPAALTILAIFGGIASFGVPGIIIGPVAAAFALSCWELFRDEYGATPRRTKKASA